MPGDTLDAVFAAFVELIKSRTRIEVCRIPHRIKTELGQRLSVRYSTANDASKAIEFCWLDYWTEVREKLPKRIPRDVFHDQSGKSAKNLIDKWGLKKTQNPTPAFASYYFAHISGDISLEIAADYIDRDILGASFKTIFHQSVPTDIAAARQLLDKVRAERSKFAEQVSVDDSVIGSGQRLDPTYPTAIRLPDTYQHGRDEFFQLKDILLTHDGTTTPISSAIYGAGGYGKSSLTQEICGDEGIQTRFPGGIYWLQFGLINSNDETAGYVPLSQAIQRMLQNQYPKDEIPQLSWNHSDHNIKVLRDILPKSPLLIIADDLWNERQSNWIAEVLDNVSILLTTRRKNIAKRAEKQIPIARLSEEASYRLLTHGMEQLLVEQEERLGELATGFRGWPLLLNLANGVFRSIDGEVTARIDKAIREYKRFFADDHIDAWDIVEKDEQDNEKRRRLVGYCIEASLNAIHPSNNPDLLRAFAVFPDDVYIPFSVAIDLWGQIADKRISTTRGLTLLRHFNDFSLFSSFDEDSETLKLHDEILAYFRSSSSRKQLQALHRALIVSMQEHCREDWSTLPPDHQYGWTQLLFHLEKAEMGSAADALRVDFQWLKGKLAAVGTRELQRTFSPAVHSSEIRDIGRAIDLAAPVLSKRPSALALQLYGRLGHLSDDRLRTLGDAARADSDCWPIPLCPHLPPLGRELLRFVGHNHQVNSVAFDLSGSRIVTASHDQTARVWDTDTGEQICKMVGHGDWVKSAAFDPSGLRIVTASHDGTARVWNADTGEQLNKLGGHRGWVSSAAFDSDGRRIVTSSYDGTTRTWNSISGEQIVVIKAHPHWVTSAAFDQSGRRLVTASFDNTARVWSSETGELMGKPLSGHREWVTSAMFDQSGCRIVTASSDGTARLWDADTCEQICEFLGHRQGITSATFDSSGTKVVTASLDKTVRQWDTRTGELVLILDGNPSRINCAVFSSSHKTIVTAAEDNTARLWDARIGTKFSRNPEKLDQVDGVALDPSGRRIITISWNKGARLWDAESGKQIGQLKGHLDGITKAAFDRSGNRIITASHDGTARMWNAGTGVPIGVPLDGHQGVVTSAAFDPSGCKIATASLDGAVRLWDAKTCRQIDELPEVQREGVASVDFDPSGLTILTASQDGYIKRWNANSCKLTGVSFNVGRNVVNAIFDPKSRNIVTTSHYNVIRLWDAESGELIGEPLYGGRKGISAFAFDASGQKMVVTPHFGNSVSLCNSATGELLTRLEGHLGWVNDAVFDPSGGRVLTASNDGSIKIWNAVTGVCLQTVDLEEEMVSAAWYRHHILAVAANGRVFSFADNPGVQP